MLIIKIDLENGIDVETFKRTLEATLEARGVKESTVLDGNQFVIKKKIPIYTLDELATLTKRSAPAGPMKKRGMIRGVWQIRHRYANIWHFCCSVCGKTSPHSQSKLPRYRYCPHCASEMETGEEEDKL